MVKHVRTDSIKPLIESGHITEFKQIFDYVPKTPIAKELGIQFGRFDKFLNKVQDMKLQDLYDLCNYFDIEPRKMFELIDNQRNQAKKNTRKK